MSILAVRCEPCGGAVTFPAGAAAPACLFCGSQVLVAIEPPEGIEPPDGFLPFLIDEAGAKARFQTFASSSIWYPGDLRHARLKLNAILLPAWRWSATLETCWAAIVPADTRSGKRPQTGADRQRIEGVLIPASQALTRRELNVISPFEEATLQPVGTDLPYETGSLTRSAAQRQGEDGLQAVRHRALEHETRAQDLRSSVVFHDLTGGPLLLPVWVGAYRRGKRVYRFVINGQSGKLVGEAPISWWRVFGAILLGVAIVGAVFACFGIFGVVSAVGARGH
ncbi:MAG: hypothetical protein EXR69_12790 [Myxococcales bacterium]|nr:hypothetical protein [Myxococcales bacterium]